MSKPILTDWGYEGEYRLAKWPGDSESRFTFKVDGDTVIVDYIKRGSAQPAGSAGEMIAEALKADRLKPTVIRAPNVLGKAADSPQVIQQMLEKAAQHLGGYVTKTNTGHELGKLFVEVHVRY